MSQRGPKRSETPPPDPAAAAAFGQDLLTQLAHDIGVARQREAQQKEAAANLANALLGKVATDFGSVPPPPPAPAASVSSMPPATPSAPPPSAGPSEEELAAAASQGPLSAEELADLDAMTASGGFWGKLVARLRGKREAG